MSYPDWKIYFDIMEGSRLSQNVPQRNERWEQREYPQRLGELSYMLKMHMIRQAGDAKQFLKIYDDLRPLMGKHEWPQDAALYKIIKWFDEKVDAVKESIATSPRFTLSFLVFGDEYLDKILNYTFPSLLAYENMPCMGAEYQVIFYVQTTASGKEKIEADASTARLKSQGVHFEYVIIPDDVVEEAERAGIVYWLLGASNSLGLYYAKQNQTSFHQSYPDVVYNNKFFSELMRLSKSHKFILQGGFRSDETVLLPALENYRKDKAISIPSSDLAALHINCRHVSAWTQFVNNRPKEWTFPTHHVILWETDDELHINSPHGNILWLDYSILKDFPCRYRMTIDSELDLLCEGGNFYIPQAKDEVYFVEFSTSNRAPVRDIYGDAFSTANQMWMSIRDCDTLKFFCKTAKVKINREVRPKPLNVMSDDFTRQMRDFIIKAMLSSDPYRGGNVRRTHEGWIGGLDD